MNKVQSIRIIQIQLFKVFQQNIESKGYYMFGNFNRKG